MTSHRLEKRVNGLRIMQTPGTRWCCYVFFGVWCSSQDAIVANEDVFSGFRSRNVIGLEKGHCYWEGATHNVCLISSSVELNMWFFHSLPYVNRYGKIQWIHYRNKKCHTEYSIYSKIMSYIRYKLPTYCFVGCLQHQRRNLSRLRKIPLRKKLRHVKIHDESHRDSIES